MSNVIFFFYSHSLWAPFFTSFKASAEYKTSGISWKRSQTFAMKTFLVCLVFWNWRNRLEVFVFMIIIFMKMKHGFRLVAPFVYRLCFPFILLFRSVFPFRLWISVNIKKFSGRKMKREEKQGQRQKMVKTHLEHEYDKCIFHSLMRFYLLF